MALELFHKSLFVVMFVVFKFTLQDKDIKNFINKKLIQEK